MADPADLADKAIEQHLTYALSTAKSASQKRLPVGVCANCSEKIAKDISFCDVDCRDDYEWRMGRKA